MSRPGISFALSSAAGSLAAPLLLSLAALIGCGPSYDDRTIKTADDRIREQEELAYQEELRQRNKPATGGVTVEEKEKVGAFDDRQAELEFQRATRSAETCPEVVTDGGPGGKTSVTVTFALDGSVASASIPPPFEGTRLGNCVLNAYQALIVPPYSGERKVITWDVNLERKAAEGDKAAKKKK
jgi:hypothetical protein